MRRSGRSTLKARRARTSRLAVRLNVSAIVLNALLGLLKKIQLLIFPEEFNEQQMLDSFPGRYSQHIPNNDDGEVEYIPHGTQIGTFVLDKS